MVEIHHGGHLLRQEEDEAQHQYETVIHIRPHDEISREIRHQIDRPADFEQGHHGACHGDNGDHQRLDKVGGDNAPRAGHHGDKQDGKAGADNG